MLGAGSKVLGVCLAVICMADLFGARQLDVPLPVANGPPCQTHNLRLFSFLRAATEESGQTLLPHKATNLDEFAVEVKDALDKNMLKDRAIHYLFSNAAVFSPTCSGIWAEFGVASGTTINLAANFRQAHCSLSCPHVHGFDTFTGLPEDWVRDDRGVFKQHDFDQGGATGRYPGVLSNVNLIKGLFNESLPGFLKTQSMYAGLADPVSYLHIDCDLYAGARDALQLLIPRLVVGTVIVFDDLVNYQYYKNHELKAFWEFTVASGAQLLPIGMLGPLPGTDMAMQLDWSKGGAANHFHQSAAFVIAQINPPRISA